MHHLEEHTKEAISKAQRARDTWEISDDEYDTKYNQLMENYQLMTQIILDRKARQDYEAIYLLNPLP